MSGDESLLKDKHILVVDDEMDIIETIMDINDRWGPGWQERDREFWLEFCRAYSVGKEIHERCFFK